MKPETNRKEIQEKLNRLIGEAVKSVIATDSKKIKKTIKRVSKILAKAVSRKIYESDGQLVLKKKSIATAVSKIATANKTVPAKTPVKSPVKAPVKVTAAKPAPAKAKQPVKKTAPVKAIKKVVVTPAPKVLPEIKNGTEKIAVK